MSQAGQVQDILLDLLPADYRYTTFTDLALAVAERIEHLERQVRDLGGAV